MFLTSARLPHSLPNVVVLPSKYILDYSCDLNASLSRVAISPHLEHCCLVSLSSRDDCWHPVSGLRTLGRRQCSCPGNSAMPSYLARGTPDPRRARVSGATSVAGDRPPAIFHSPVVPLQPRETDQGTKALGLGSWRPALGIWACDMRSFHLRLRNLRTQNRGCTGQGWGMGAGETWVPVPCKSSTLFQRTLGMWTPLRPRGYTWPDS